MVFDVRRVRLMLLVILAPALVACTVAEAGSATTGSGSVTATGSAPSMSSPASDQSVVITPGEWTSAEFRPGPAGIPAPTGDLTAVPDGDRICFRPVVGGVTGTCSTLATDDRPVFAVYSPDGRQLLMVAGPEGSADRSIYVVDTAGGAVRVIGPDGIIGSAEGPPPRWDVSTVAWSADGTSVVVVPRTDSDTGSVWSADIGTGAVTATGAVPAELANSTPSIWPTRNGTAWVANSGGDRQTLWWQESAAAAPTSIARFGADGGSLLLSTVDPLGRVVVTCPRSTDGRLGASVFVGVANRKSGPLLPDSGSCAGIVFSPDGGYLAATAQLATGYTLIIIDVQTNRRLLTAPLPVTEPSTPPYLTWLGDVVVVSDVSGAWAAPSLIVRLQ